MSNKPYRQVSVGTIVRSDKGRAAITLFAKDPKSGDFYGITDTFILAGGQLREAYAQGETGVGIAMSSFPGREENADLASKLAAFRVMSSIEIANHDDKGSHSIAEVAGIHEYLTDNAIILGKNDIAIAVDLAEFGVDVDLTEEPGTRRYSDAILAVPESGKPEAFDEIIYSGAPVINLDTNNIIGAVVGRTEESVIVAPVQRLLEQLGLILIMGSERVHPKVASSNSRPDTPQPAAPTVNFGQRAPKDAVPARTQAFSPSNAHRSISSANRRIAGVQIPANKKVKYALRYIHGIGLASAQAIVDKLGIEEHRRVNDLSDAEFLEIREVIDRDYTVEGDLRREVSLNIKRLMDLACYRGLRHRKGLPVRGQRTHTNARTRKGPAKPVPGKKK